MADMYTILFAVVMSAGSGVTVIVTDKAGRRVSISYKYLSTHEEQEILNYFKYFQRKWL